MCGQKEESGHRGKVMDPETDSLLSFIHRVK